MKLRLGTAFLIPAMWTAGVVCETSARGQAPPPARVGSYQRGAAPQPGVVGFGFVDPVMVDPVAMNYLYATGVPMTRGQVGLSAVSSLQRASGIGSGRISGVRGGGVVEESKRSATHTRDANVPGGQASGFFNRMGPSIPTSVSATPNASDSGRFYGRQSRYFPSPAR